MQEDQIGFVDPQYQYLNERVRNSIESLTGSTRWDRRRRQMSVEFRFRRNIFLSGKMDPRLISSGYMAACDCLLKKIIYLFRFLFLSPYCSCEHICAGTPLLLKSPRNTDAKSTRGSRKALIKGTQFYGTYSVLFTISLPLYRIVVTLTSFQVRVESVTSL